MPRGPLAISAAALLVATAMTADAQNASSSGDPRERAPASASDTTGLSGSRPGCLPRRAANETASSSDVRPDDETVGSAAADGDIPRVMSDPAPGSGRTTETGVGGTRASPQSMSDTAKPDDC